MNSFAETLIVCDFDGTISQADLGHALLSSFSLQSWDDIDAEYCAGRLGSREAYTRVAAVVRGTQGGMVEFVRRHGALDPGFASFYRKCRLSGGNVVIVSDGLTFYIDLLLNDAGLEGVERYANELHFDSEGGIRITFPYAEPSCGRCGTCKAAVVRRLSRACRRMIYVGNGYSDVCPSTEADIVFAKDILLSKMVAAGMDSVPYRTFHDISRHLFAADIRQDA